jgi:hypothetical protein
MIPGFFFRETMRGTYWRLEAPTDEQALDMTLKVTAASARRFLRDKTWQLEGTMNAEGLATDKPVEGTIEFRILDERRLPYRVRFTGDDGRSYELRGQKEWTPLAPLESMTVLPMTLLDASGAEIGRATLRFDARNELGQFLGSFRVAFS